VAEIVLEIVPLGFERAERFVLQLPARAAAGGHLDDVGAIDGQIGGKSTRRRGLVNSFDLNDQSGYAAKQKLKLDGECRRLTRAQNCGQPG
jgi:hypothetical protein